MKVYVFSAYAGWCPSFEYELEIIQDHLDAGDEVVMGVCNSTLPTCDPNPRHAIGNCAGCIGRRLFGLTRLTQAIRQIPIIQLQARDKRDSQALPATFESLDEVRNFTAENFDLGMAALSSVITTYRESKPDLKKPEVARMLHRFMASAFSIYRSTLNILAQEKFDRVYVMNGRLAIPRAILRACQAAGVDCFTLERGWNLEHFSVHKNTLIHDLTYLRRIIHEAWERADPVHRVELASNYYIRRVGGEGFNWRSFIGGQQAGLLPDNWDASQKNVALFTSSDDEIAALGKFWPTGPIYQDQAEGVRRIAAEFASRPDMHLYIRVHPNMENVNCSTVNQLLRLQGARVTVIPPDSTVCSYALLRNSRKSITFSSRMGIEAAFWEIPSILAGHTPYRTLGSTYNPESHAELMELVDQELLPKDRTGALIFGYHLHTFGRRARHFESTGYCVGKYRSIELRETGMFSQLRLMLLERPRLSQALSALSATWNSLRIGAKVR